MDWNDLKLFLTVARLGGLRASAAQTGVSPATLGRRIAALERTIGRPLFHRSVSGYTLTEAGEGLLRRAEEAESAMRAIAQWGEGMGSGPVVRLSVGVFMSLFLGTRIGDLWQVSDRVQIEIDATFEDADVLRREADIDLRQHRPNEPMLTQRHIGPVAHAIYSGRQRINGVAEGYFVGMSGSAGRISAARWLEARHGDRIGLRCSDVQSCMTLVASGAGLSVFPCFAGDSDPRLVRLGSPIPELSQDLWMVTHSDRRREAPVRRVADRLSALLETHRALLAGERPRA